MAGADLLKRIITTCGYCLEQQIKDTKGIFTKSARTAHIVVDTFKDDDLKQRVQIIQCTRCGIQIEWVPRMKLPKAEAERRLAAWEQDGYEKRLLAKLARQRRLALEKLDEQRKKKPKRSGRTRKG